MMAVETTARKYRPTLPLLAERLKLSAVVPAAETVTGLPRFQKFVPSRLDWSWIAPAVTPVLAVIWATARERTTTASRTAPVVPAVVAADKA